MQPGNRPTGGFGKLLQDILDEMFDTSTRPPYGSGQMTPEQQERQRQLREAQRRMDQRTEMPADVPAEVPIEVPSEEQPQITLEQRGLDREEAQETRRRQARGPVAARRPTIRNDVRASLSNRRNLRRAIVLSEILGPPKALQKERNF